MRNGLVVKDNALINASYNLELTEQRLVLLAIINARGTGQGITADSKIEIRASDYAKHLMYLLMQPIKHLKRLSPIYSTANLVMLPNTKKQARQGLFALAGLVEFFMLTSWPS